MSVNSRNLIKKLQKADDGDLDAMFDIITMCYTNKDKRVMENTAEKCCDYIRKLAMCGETTGYIWMADAFRKGEFGYPKDITKTIRLYEKAAENGQEFGYECIGELYYKGEEVSQDYKKAFEYFNKAENRSTNSLYYLGEMYRLGLYLDPDEEKARECYQDIVDMADDQPLAKEDLYYMLAKERLSGNYRELHEEDYI